MYVYGRLNRTVSIAALAALCCASFVGQARAQSRPPATASTTQKSTPAKPVATPAAKKPAATTTRAAAARTRAARARAAALARAAAAARLVREANTPRFKKDALGNIVPDVRAAAAIVFNPQTNEVLWEANSHDRRSIASLTKIMTGVVFIADEPDLSRQVTVVTADVRGANVTYLRAGEKLPLRDVLNLTLIASDNAAARILARTSEGGTPAFVGRMNDMARQLGLTNSQYADPSGLDARNVSSAYDVSHLMAFASANPQLASVMSAAQYQVRTNRRVIKIHSTNKLLGTGMDIVAGKTGFIKKAGYCFATLLQIPHGSQVAVVVLGATNSTLRFAEARHLFNWVVGRANGLVGGGEIVER